MAFQIVKAQKSKAKLRIGLSGASGAGKTWSSLLLASGISPWDKICVIDSENGSASLYSQLGEYNTMIMEAPYSPARYIEAIKACEQAGMETIIIDSISPEWEGEGGCLQINELLAKTKFKGNTWSAWSETTPKHQAFISAIVSSRCHIITTARAKTDIIQTEDKKIKKVGMKEIQRDGFEYELTVNFTLDRERNYAIASKDRTTMFINEDPFIITADTGKKLLDWVNDGVDVVIEKPLANVIEEPTGNPETIERIRELFRTKETTQTEKGLLKYFKVESLSEVLDSKLNSIIEKLEALPNYQSVEKPLANVEKVNVQEVAKAIEEQTVVEELITPANIKFLNIMLNDKIKKGYSEDSIRGKIFDKYGVAVFEQITAKQFNEIIKFITEYSL